MDHQLFTTHEHEPGARRQRWQHVIGTAYFNLQLAFQRQDIFDGSLESWDFGTLSVSRLITDPISYRRLNRHCVPEEDSYLINIPEQSEVHFEQMHREVWCKPGGFILENSNEPFLFEYPARNAMWVLKIPGEVLRARLRNPSLQCAIPFDVSAGPCALFMDYLKFLMNRWQHLPREVRCLMSQHLIDLLVVALEMNPNAVRSELSVVREAHLRRIEAHIRTNLGDPDLSPAAIAGACGLSLRYLHSLFRETEYSVSGWVRELRLQAAREQLERSPASTQISAVAYQWGFNDLACFSTAFKQRFDITPSDFRARARRESSLSPDTRIN